MMNTILNRNKSLNASEKFIINLRHKQKLDSKLIISDQRRIIFLSLTALYKTWRLCPTEILFPSIFILPLKKQWIVNPKKHRNCIQHYIKFNIDLSNDTNRKQFDEFVQLIQWKNSQNLCFWLFDENDSFSQNFNKKLVTLYNPITNSKYNPIQVFDIFKYDVQTFQKMLNQSNPNSFNMIVSYDFFKEWQTQMSLVTTLNERSLKCKFTNAKKISNSLQGGIWLVENDAKDTQYVVKVTSKTLHRNSATVANGQQIICNENIETETKILKNLTMQKDSPNTIIKYIDSIETHDHYFLVMEYGGNTLFDFVVKVHQFIAEKRLSISDWHKCVKIIFKQLLETVNYLHSKGVAHHDISLENIVINDVAVEALSNGRIRFDLDSIHIKLIDFGLAGIINGKETALSEKYVGKNSYMAPEIWEQIPFDPFANDIWCCGVCVFGCLIGCLPYRKASMNDSIFRFIIKNKFMELFKCWGKASYVTADIIDLFSGLFQYESKRITLKKLLNHSWINTN